MTRSAGTVSLRAGRRSVDISRPEKVLFPDAGITKRELAGYYLAVAPAMLPYLADRPLTLERWPDGITKQRFYQKDASDYFPDWIRSETMAKEGGTVRHVVADDAATLVYLANQAAITLHIWQSRADRPGHPDRMVFDLDPEEEDFDAVRAGARHLRAALEETGLPSWVMTTGSRGLHVVVPLDRRADYGQVFGFSRGVAELVVRRYPERFTTEFRKKDRDGRVFVDVLRNRYAQTAVAPWSVRGRPGAPVAMPISWEELEEEDMGPRRFDLRNAPDRVAGDAWAGIRRRARSLTAPAKKLRRLLAAASG